ncbi:DNA-binding transcriptional LysR family regulator [Scopulibacillus darangshiensis]|uniref:DNA-binding transcriptional LysR family regulator n=1 Tax=Scopulibacillus darangshiensis TaxID=442528 RepID=A0A4R2P4H9_9BACL|nr:LysR family transcriptional regulator [Scopulibacillus darangshiensis]TCP29719.1 DNA-binding transcriptional LysR family regulator [Scopulibacillus darangshiensis]
MDIKHLQYLIEVTRFNSFSKAADHLFVTQPTISKAIKGLESELGVTLFDRSRKQILLTDAGKIILEQAQVINKAFEDLQIQIDDLSQLKKGHIRVGLPPMIGTHFFPAIIGQFRERYPAISIELVEDGSKKVVDDVENGSLDIGAVVLPTNETLFHSFSFVKEEIKLIVHPEHRLAGRKKVKLSELTDEHFMLFNDDFALHDRIMASCMVAGFQPKVISKSSQWDFIGKMVASKLCVTLLPESKCLELKDDIRVISATEPNVNWELAIIWRRNRYLSYAAKELLKFTKEQFE